MKINFVCFGNICRSPMAEYVMKNLVERKLAQTLRDEENILARRMSNKELPQ